MITKSLFYVNQKNINPILLELSDEAKLQFNSIYDMALFLKGKFNNCNINIEPPSIL